jgi:hypothetical protein
MSKGSFFSLYRAFMVINTNAMRTSMARSKQKPGGADHVINAIPSATAVEREIRRLTQRVRILLALLKVCHLAEEPAAE